MYTQSFSAPDGIGIKDGRGYGPYNAGYYQAGPDTWLPIGPRGERLGPAYDFQRNSQGSYLPPLRPLLVLPGRQLGATDEGPGIGKGILMLGIIVIGGALIFGFGGAGAFDRPRHRDYDDFDRPRRDRDD
jgi:hypothetical protein